MYVLRNEEMENNMSMYIGGIKQDAKTNKEEIFRIFYAWTAAFFLMEPLTSLLVLDKKDGLTILKLMTDYIYSSVTFLNVVYVYKHIFKKPDYFPKEIGDFPLFVAIYTFIQLAFDAIWLISTGRITMNYPLKDVFQRYDKITKLSHSIHIITYGLIWLNITYFFYNYVRPLDSLATIIGSIFIMLLLHYKPVARIA